MRFNCVIAALERFVPDLKGLLNTASQELLLIKVPNACHQILVSRGVLMLFLHYKHVFRDVLHVMVNLISATLVCVTSIHFSYK